MKEPEFDTIEDAFRKKTPDDPEAYIGHEKWLTERLGPGTLKSTQKEIEGMARLVAAVEDQFDEDQKEILLSSLRAERNRLRELEHEIQEVRDAIND